MSDALGDDAPAPMISSPLLDDTSAPTQTTTSESLESVATAGWRNATEVWRNPAALNANQTPGTEAYQGNLSLGLEGPTYAAPYAGPPLTLMKAEDANAANKAAGGTLTPFSHDTSKETFDGMLADNLVNNKDADVIARSAAGIIATPARAALGMMVSLADPRNIAAMMIPGVGEAKVAEMLGGGMAARAGAGAAVGGAQNLALGIGLAPLQYAQATTDHEDFSWGDTLRNAAFMAVLGAGGGALHGLLTRAGPETTEAALKAALAPVLQDHPAGVDIQAILDQHGVPPVAAGDVRLYHGGEEPTSGGARWVTTDPNYAANFRGSKPVSYVDLPADHPLLKAAQGIPDEDIANGVTTKQFYGHFEVPEDIAKDFKPFSDPALANQSAQAMASRAQNVTDPELTQGQHVIAHTAEAAPKLEGLKVSQDTTEAAQMAADKKAEYDGLVASGQIIEHPSLADVGKLETEYGKGAAAYAETCGFGS